LEASPPNSPRKSQLAKLAQPTDPAREARSSENEDYLEIIYELIRENKQKSEEIFSTNRRTWPKTT